MGIAVSSPGVSDVGEGHISLFPCSLGVTVVQGTFSLVAGGTINPWFVNAGAIDDEITFNVFMEKSATYSISVIGLADTDFGIATVSIDSTSVGTMDFFAGVGAPDTIKTIANVTVPTSSLKVLSFKMHTKNAGSSNYRFGPQAIKIWRTA